MRSRAAAKARRLLFLAAVCLLSALLVVPTAEASRSLPAALAPVIESPAMPDQVLGESDAETQPRHRLFGDLSLLERPLDVVPIQKTASGVFALGIQSNIRQTGGLAQNRSGPSFQGLWTDPVTGIAYARNRWYDARTASWLSEDPMGAVDSPNLYAFVAWGPHMGTDPMGTCNIWGIPIGGDPEVSCFDVLGDAVPFLGQELKGEAEFVLGFGEGVYESPDVFANRTYEAAQGAAGAVKEFALNPAVLPEKMISGLKGTVNAAYTLSNADSDVLVMVVADEAADQWREFAAKGPREIGRMIGREAPIMILTEGAGEVLFASRGLAVGDDVLDFATRIQRYGDSIPDDGIGRAIRTYYPPRRGFEGETTRLFLRPGQRIDRYGGDDVSRFFSPAGTPEGARALPPGTSGQPLRTFEVVKPFEVEAGAVAPYYGQLGLGIQYESPVTLKVLLGKGIIREVAQ